MSHRRHLYVKLVCLATACLPVSLLVLRSPQTSQRVPEVPAQSEHASDSPQRYPMGEVHNDRAIALASFAFQAPPLPQGVRPPGRASTGPAVSTEAQGRRRVERLPTVRRPQPAPNASPIVVKVEPWRPQEPVTSGITRLPPVANPSTEPPTPTAIKDQTVFNPLRIPSLEAEQLRPAKETAPVVPRTESGRSSEFRRPQPAAARRTDAGVTAAPHKLPTRATSRTRRPELVPIAMPRIPHTTGSGRPRGRSVLTPQIPGPDPALAAVSRQAMALVQHGRSLAMRNAQFSARADFIKAMRMIAQAHDAVQGGSYHTNKLSAGLQALREAEDFSQDQATRWNERFEVSIVASGHGTPVVRQMSKLETAKLTPWAAQREYYMFAQQQLSESGAGDAVSSLALFSLGKLYIAGGTAGDGELLNNARAMVYFQSALKVDPRNYAAANELGVLLARLGQLPDARSVLRHAVKVNPRYAATWGNLATVHDRMGEVDMARRARNEFQLASTARPAESIGASEAIRWVEPEEFSRTNNESPQRRAAARTPAENAEVETDAKPFWQFWK